MYVAHPRQPLLREKKKSQRGGREQDRRLECSTGGRSHGRKLKESEHGESGAMYSVAARRQPNK